MNDPNGQIAIDSLDIHPIRRPFVLQNLKNSMEDDLTFIMAWVFAIVFLGISLVHGFSVKPIFGNNGMFVATNVAQNIFDFVYLVTAIGIVTVTLFGEKETVKFIQAVGKVYMLAALIGFMRFGDLQNYSEWGGIINLGLGAALFVAGSFLQDYRHKLLVSRLIAKQRQSSSCNIMDKIKETSLGTVLEEKKGTNGLVGRCKDLSETQFVRGSFI